MRTPVAKGATPSAWSAIARGREETRRRHSGAVEAGGPMHVARACRRDPARCVAVMCGCMGRAGMAMCVSVLAWLTLTPRGVPLHECAPRPTLDPP